MPKFHQSNTWKAQTRSCWPRWCLTLCLVGTLLLGSWTDARAQRVPLGKINQAFGACQFGITLPFAAAFSTVPSLVMFIGNLASRGRGSARAWGIGGTIVGAIGLTTESGLLVAVAATGQSSPCDGAHIAIGLSSLLLHAVTFGLSVNNVVTVERKIIKRMFYLRRKLKAKYAQERIQRRKERNSPKDPGASGKSKKPIVVLKPTARALAKARQRPRKPGVPIDCQKIFALYRTTLNDALTSEDKDASTPLLDKLEREYNTCFKTGQGQIYLQERQTILRNVRPSLPRSAPLIKLPQRRPPVRRASKRLRPPKRRARPTPRRRRAAPPKRRTKQSLSDSILNQIAAGKIPVTRRKPAARKPAARKPASKRVAPRSKVKKPPPVPPTAPRNLLLQLEL